MERTSAEITQEITAGESLAVNIKRFFHADEAWTPKLALEIGYKMGAIKKAARIFYVDKDMISILHSLATFNKDDLEDLLNFKTT